MIKVWLPLLCTVLLGTSLIAQQFEGDIQMIILGEGTDDVNLLFTFKDHMVKMSTSNDDGKVDMITDRKSRMVTTLIDSGGNKMAIQRSMDASDMSALLNMRNVEAESSTGGMTIRKTDNWKEIHGLKCYKVTAESQTDVGYAWVTDELGASMSDLIPMDPSAGSSTSEFERVYGKDGFIIEMESKNKQSGEVVRIETKPKKRSVNMSEFAIPKDTPVMNENSMMDMIKEAGGDADKLREMGEKMRQQYGTDD